MPVRRAAALWLVMFAVFAAGLGLAASPGNDLSVPEARYLLTARSLVDDGDFDLRDDYRERAWSGFFAGTLAPLGRERDGRLFEPTGLGFPVLIAPAYAVGGRLAVELVLAAIAALGFVLAAALARRIVPEPWATSAVLAVGLSPPAVIGATTIAPDAIAGTALAGAALLALQARETPRLGRTFAAGMLLAPLPWLALRFLAPVVVVAVALYRWSRRRNRAMAGLLGVEAVIFSVVMYAAINDPVFGGLTPYAALPAGVEPTGASGVVDHLARTSRLITVWVDPDVGLLRWAPALGLVFVTLWLLARSRRERLAAALGDQVDVEVSTAFLVLIGVAVLGVAAFLVPTLEGPWFAGHAVVSALPVAGAVAGWGLRRLPRLGAVLAALTVILTAWLLIAVRVSDDAGVAPARGPGWAGFVR